jgi:hypothetical protein
MANLLLLLFFVADDGGDILIKSAKEKWKVKSEAKRVFLK